MLSDFVLISSSTTLKMSLCCQTDDIIMVSKHRILTINYKHHKINSLSKTLQRLYEIINRLFTCWPEPAVAQPLERCSCHRPCCRDPSRRNCAHPGLIEYCRLTQAAINNIRKCYCFYGYHSFNNYYCGSKQAASNKQMIVRLIRIRIKRKTTNIRTNFGKAFKEGKIECQVLLFFFHYSLLFFHCPVLVGYNLKSSNITSIILKKVEIDLLWRFSFLRDRLCWSWLAPTSSRRCLVDRALNVLHRNTL